MKTIFFLLMVPALCFSKPNIIVLMVDDLDQVTYEDALRQNLMPNLKSLIISKGVSFSESFVSDPICCSSRATLLTGLYPHNHGVLNVKRDKGQMGLSYWLESSGVSEMSGWPVKLRKAGYRTAHVGKYLNGYGSDSDSGYVPPGYDDWRGLVDPTTYAMYGYKMNINGSLKTYGKKSTAYQTDVLARHARQIIFANTTKPLALVIAPVAPHTENGYENDISGSAARFTKSIQPAPRHSYLADGNKKNGELADMVIKSSVFESDLSDKHPNIANLSAVTNTDRSAIQMQYKQRLASLMAVDDLIGTVFTALGSRVNDTVFIFTSDNGWHYGEHRISGKSWPYEESIRVPLVIRAPGKAENLSSTKPVSNVDLAPTILEFAGVSAQTDGRSVLPLLVNPSGAQWLRTRVFIEWFMAGYSSSTKAPSTYAAVRELSAMNQNFLYARYYDDSERFAGDTKKIREFYDVASDPTQENGVMLQSSGLDSLLDRFTTCSGEDCRSVEEGGYCTETYFQIHCDGTGRPRYEEICVSANSVKFLNRTTLATNEICGKQTTIP